MTIRPILRPLCWIFGHYIPAVPRYGPPHGVWVESPIACLRCRKMYSLRTMTTPTLDMYGFPEKGQTITFTYEPEDK